MRVVWMPVGDDEADMFVMAVLPGSKTELPFISIVSNTAPLSLCSPLAGLRLSFVAAVFRRRKCGEDSATSAQRLPALQRATPPRRHRCERSARISPPRRRRSSATCRSTFPALCFLPPAFRRSDGEFSSSDRWS